MTGSDSGTGSPLALDSASQDLLFRRAHTADAFADDPVADETVREIHDLVTSVPTASGGQPLRVVLVRSAAGRERLLRHMSRGNREKTARAPLVAVLAAERPSAVPDGALQAAYFIIAVRAAGLAAGPMSGFDAEGVDREFFADTKYSALMVVNIGRPTPDGHRPRGPRLDFDQVFSSI
ncbi:nitroreductase family protein [Streptomyces sp. SID8361]|uniref:nitroreductase family protein n=1 Tax=Streptomyces sp. MnatMP-M27 TaxID=1839768 RepID=UPI00081DFEF6|nr:nitroreductase family protein [Streptomyces sp. MnatMP-M27]MYU10695.1 nitroreductase family protein [Streptomyces sp. SID8361]SCF74341.1 3-hydroxypropanoate dehydrogenase [Streptomyces sp. MnatMP-M27]